MNIGSLFSGIGGFELAGEWCGHRTIWQSDIDPYCVALLAERFPYARQLGNITRIDWRDVERPDIITGGFPCQDISLAGKGAGLAGARSGLWYEYARAIRELGPDYVIVENVAALLARGIGDVLGTLASLGYDAEWTVRSAADVGALHLRRRLWVLAYPTRQRSAETRELRRDQLAEWAPGRCHAAAGAAGPGRSGNSRRPLADADSARCWQGDETDARRSPEQLDGCGVFDAERQLTQAERTVAIAAATAHARAGSRSWWATEPDVGRVAYGVPAWVDRLQGLGNAIVPACAIPIFHRIGELERERVSGSRT